MIACGITPEYAVMAADSALYQNDVMEYQTPKLLKLGGKYLVTFIGATMFLERININIFQAEMNDVVTYLVDHFTRHQPIVEAGLKGTDIPANFCFYLLGVKHGTITLIELNSYRNFAPVFTEARNGIKFSSLFYGDDENKDKQELFQRASEYMERKASKHDRMTPGLLGEIVTRGIYHKADMEEKIGEKRKYAGGVVTVGLIDNTGKITGLSNLVS